MIALLIVGLIVIAGLFVCALTYRRDWLRERDARLALHRARILDNDQRAIDNERWAERVEQARGERRLVRLAPETAEEHVRNALTVLNFGAEWSTAELVAYQRRDVEAITNRLYLAIGGRH